MAKCDKCDGDGYIEYFNDDHSGVITEICPDCDGDGEDSPYKHFYDGTELEGFYG